MIVTIVPSQNCGVNTIRTMTTLTAKHATEGNTWGVDGETGKIVDMNDFGVWDTFQVRDYRCEYVSRYVYDTICKDGSNCFTAVKFDTSNAQFDLQNYFVHFLI